eukprot:1734154-Pleurochrysis_carterae.AAC.1
MLRGLARAHAERGRVAYALWARARIVAQQDNMRLRARRTPASGAQRAPAGGRAAPSRAATAAECVARRCGARPT